MPPPTLSSPQALQTWAQETSAQGEEAVSLALCWVSADCTIHDVVATRQAAKWCEKVVVAANHPLSALQQQLFSKAGADAFICFDAFAPTGCTVQLPVKNKDVMPYITPLLQSILALLPSGVAVSPAYTPAYGAVVQLLEPFPNLFTLLAEETPARILTESARKVRADVKTFVKQHTSAFLSADLSRMLQKKHHLSLQDIRLLNARTGLPDTPQNTRLLCAYSWADADENITQDAFFMEQAKNHLKFKEFLPISSR